METISNYPKLARANIIYRIEVIYLILQTVGIIVVSTLLIIHIQQIKKALGDENASKFDDGLIIGHIVLMILLYLGQTVLVFILYKGVKEKHYRKLTFWLLFQVAVVVFYSIDFIIDLVEKKHIGSTNYLITLIIIVYRTVAVKIVYDAIQELRQFPVTVPFVQMRDCEDRV